MAEIVVADIDAQTLRQVELRALCNSRTLQEELMLLIIDGLSEIHDPETVRSAFRNATVDVHDYQPIDERSQR